MQKVIIRRVSISEVESNESISDILKEYGNECAINGMPPIVDKLIGYKLIESSGVLNVFGAFLAEKLIGIVAVLGVVVPHYGALICATESLFVLKEYRNTGAGTMLIKKAEDFAKELGSLGILLSAPKNGILEKILPHKGYKETNTTFFKRFDDAA